MRAGPLDLRPMVPDDLPVLAPLLADPAMWAHDPAGRPADPDAVAAYVARAAARWGSGLSYWTVRLAATGEVVGSGGAQHHTRGGADHWNLNYRVAVPHQGRGYAGLLLAAALDAARTADPDRPCVAWIDATNLPSRRVAARGGLTDHGLRLNPVDAPRLAYADRPLDDDVYSRVDGDDRS